MMKLTYHRKGDYLFPNLVIETENAPQIGKYGMLRNITRINNVLEGFADSLEESKRKPVTLEQQLETAKEEVAKPFPQEQELMQKEARLSELNALLNMDERGSEAALIDEEATVDEEPQGRDAAEEQREDTVEADEPEQDDPEQDEEEQPAAKSRRYQMAI